MRSIPLLLMPAGGGAGGPAEGGAPGHEREDIRRLGTVDPAGEHFIQLFSS